MLPAAPVPVALRPPAPVPVALQPIFRVVGEECSRDCLALFWPYLSTLLNVADVNSAHGREQLRGFARCLGQLHERATLAEAAAQHWETQWRGSFKHVMEQRQSHDFSAISKEVELQELQKALDASEARGRDMAMQLSALHRTHFASTQAVQAHQFEDQRRWQAAHQAREEQASAARSQSMMLDQCLREEAQTVKQLREEIQQSSIDLEAERMKVKSMQKDARAAEVYALNIRADRDSRVQTALEEQRRKYEAQLQEERTSHAAANLITREEALRVLGAYADLWRSGASAHTGFRWRTAEQAVRELTTGSSLLTPDSDLVQEPLRRAVGEEAARSFRKTVA